MDAKKPEVPQYQLLERSFLNDKLYEAGEIVYWNDPPGGHMMPLNEAARAQVQKFKDGWLGNPIDSLPIISKTSH